MRRKTPVRVKHSMIAFVFALFFLYGLLLEAGAPVRAEGQTITFWHTMRGQKKEVFEELVKRFQKENPDITVIDRAVLSPDERMGNDYSALYSKLLESIVQKNPPDVAQVYENWTTQLIEINALVPADSFKGKYGLTENDRDDFFPIFLEANTFDGKLWTMPFNKSIYVLYYNKKLFASHSIATPKTWDELRTAARTLTERDGDQVTRYGLVYTPSVDVFGHWLYANGGNFISGDKAVFSDATGIKSLEYWVQLTNGDRAALPSFNAHDDFIKEKAAMYIDSTSRIGNLSRHCPFEFGIAPIPEGNTRSYQFAGTNLAIFNSSSQAKQEAAWRFVRFLSSADVTAYWASATGYLPVRQSALKNPTYLAFLKSNPDYRVGIASIQFARIQPKNPAWESIRGYINDAVYEAISQTSTPSQALEKAASFSNGLLKSIKGN
jgi:multiple sugar transport system substrate-binding protein